MRARALARATLERLGLRRRPAAPPPAVPPPAAAAPEPAGLPPAVMSGRCPVCGRDTTFHGDEPRLFRETLRCAVCLTSSRYRAIARGILRAAREIAGVEAPCIAALREARPARRLAVYDTQPPFAYGTVAYPLPDLLAECDWIDLTLSRFDPAQLRGAPLGGAVTNQDLEALTFPDASFDVVVTSDVMEHVRLDALAHREIARVVRPGGAYLFTVPHWTDRTRPTLVRVATPDPDDPARDVHVLEPEYHGDTNSPDGRALSYRVYGPELDATLEGLGFAVDYTMADLPQHGIVNTELFYCRKRA